ncbi:MAG: hypothetical protein M3O25_03645 [Actinomycetota bacterium]|nr:hypothetical protein [Actinomycetota bacterium]
MAIAAGLVIGVVLPPIMPSWGVIAGAAPLGILASALVLNGDDEPVWPAFAIGLLGAGLAAMVSRDIASGAARRERGGAEIGGSAPLGVTALIVLGAIVVAALSLVVPPFSLVVLTALAWIWLMRRRRAERKHEGLRVLR